MIGAQTEFAMRFQEFVFYAGPLVQIFYWVVLAFSAIYAVVLLKRLVDVQLHAAALAEDRAGDQASKSVSVDEFVE